MRLSLALSSSPCVSAHLLVSPPHCAGRHNIWMCDPEGSGLPVHPECAAGTHNKDTNKKARLEKNQSRRIQRKQWSVEPPVKTIFFWGFSPAVNFIYNHLANTEERPPHKSSNPVPLGLSRGVMQSFFTNGFKVLVKQCSCFEVYWH